MQLWVMEGDRERLIVGCVTGEVLVVEALDLKVVLHTEGAAAADCIVPFSKGFLVGQSNGAVAVFERDDRDSYLRSKVCSYTFHCCKCIAKGFGNEPCDNYPIKLWLMLSGVHWVMFVKVLHCCNTAPVKNKVCRY